MKIDELLSRFKGVKRSGSGWTARCPAHQDRNNSLSIGAGDKGIVIKCHAGCSADGVVKSIGLELRDLFPDEEKRLKVIPRSNRAHVHTSVGPCKIPKTPANALGLTVLRAQITLADYAEAKAFPVEFLSELGLRDRQRDGKSVISIPYFSIDGRVVATRYRIAMAGDRFRWRGGAKPPLYGLWRLEDARKAGHVVIVEGESDCHTAWYHEVPAVGLPGAANWRDERDTHHLDGIEKIYVCLLYTSPSPRDRS